ncbi:hypothetical protein OESDEN_08247 [Oesophagostomum dentatum]|uniref:P2X purinoreceptor 7 intracellular domain-containing protein n=1 Tax=Oesophagostomum dentatum TaxID=61180 RepID=A0A0B1T6V4_OESDE|nr:hypothetical protein OESDEN_08247 [Oesophagostomum dentatum]
MSANNVSRNACPVPMGNPNPEDVAAMMVRMGMKRAEKNSDYDPRIYCYYAYRSFVLWAYGSLGLSKRFEIPACVRAKIMSVYPLQESEYVGCKAVGSGLPLQEQEEEAWRNAEFNFISAK